MTPYNPTTLTFLDHQTGDLYRASHNALLAYLFWMKEPEPGQLASIKGRMLISERLLSLMGPSARSAFRATVSFSSVLRFQNDL